MGGAVVSSVKFGGGGVFGGGGGISGVGVTWTVRMYRWFIQTWSKCPLIMSMNGGEYFCTSTATISGMDVR